MPTEARVKVVGQLTSSPSGVIQINTDEVVNADSPCSITEIHLASGDNTITPPNTTPGIALGCIVIPDITSTTLKKLKGVAGDTGVSIGQNRPFMLTWDFPSSFIINSSAADTGKRTIIVFF